MQRKSSRSAGSISVSLAMLTGTFSLGLVLQDWYVDVNAPSCGTGTGTQGDPFCNIMDAVAAATDGDTIHIAPGTYFENVVLDKNLHLVSAGGQQATVIDGAASGRVVRVENSGADREVTLKGLTLTNGTAIAGGGLIAYGYSLSHRTTVLLQDCSLIGNSAIYGGAISAPSASVTVVGSLMRDNVAWFGGAAFVLGSSGGILHPQGDLTLTNSTVTGNTATGSTAGGGAIWNEGSLRIQSSRVTANSAIGMDVQGGGIWTGGSSLIQNSTLTGNTASGSNYAAGGGLFDSGYLTLTGSTVSGNSALGALSYGDGIRVYYGGSCDPAYYDDRLAISNSVLWDNGSAPISISGSPCSSVEYSLVEGGWLGAGNIDADPLFVDAPNGDFRLLTGSPCIDAGNNLAVSPGLWTDLAGKRRFIDDPLTLDTGHPGRLLPIVDMGAHEFGLDPPKKVRDAHGVPVR